MTLPGPVPAPWWHARGVVRRFVADLVADELGRQRRRPVRPAAGWNDALSLDEDLGVDSLELLSLGSALTQALHLHRCGIEDYLLARRRLGDWVDVAQAGLAHFDGALSFRTSGSTGQPKACEHAIGALWEEAAFLAVLLPRRMRVLRAVPVHHIYGFLFGILLPQALGLPAEAVQDVRASLPTRVIDAARSGDVFIGHPGWWAGLAASGLPWPEDVVGTTSTAPLHDETAHALVGPGRLARLVQVYGASETGGIGWREAAGEPYELMPHWQFMSGTGSGIAPVAAGAPRAPVSLQDHIDRVDGRRFHVGARRDDAVQVGGTNVFPARVRDVLRAHPLVADAVVRPMLPSEGDRLKALVVPRAGAPADPLAFAEALGQWARAHLQPAERPQAIAVGPRLPLTPEGKPADWPVA